MAALIVLVMPIPAMAPTSHLYSVPDGSAQLSTLNGFSPLAAFTYIPCVACASIGQPVFFEASWSISPNGPIVSYTWNFGDGTPPTKTNNTNISHVYLSSFNIWQVSLTVQDTIGQTDTVSQQVLFNVQPGFVFQPAKPAVSQPVTFNASSTQIYQSPGSLQGFQWYFGDGITGSGKLVSHAYTTAGLYRVSLSVLTTQGDAQISKTIVVGKPTPGLSVVLRSIFGIAFYNSSGRITIQPATLLLNMTVQGSNSTGISFSVDSGRITIGPSPVVTVQRAFLVVSGQAFLSYYGRLTIQAQMTESGLRPVPSSIYQLFLTGPTRFVFTNSTWTFFTRLFGFLYNSQTRIGLFFVAGISPGDVDESGTVDVRDLSTAASCFGTDTAQSSATAPTASTDGYPNAYYADMNGDGRVDIQDVSSIAASFGQNY